MDQPQFESQKLRRFCEARLLNIADFPIYYLEFLSERHFIIAGGGGSTKTGVHNQINILEICPNDDSCTAKLVLKYLTPKDVPDAIMNGSLFRDQPIINPRLATSGTKIIIYDIEYNLTDKTFFVKDHFKLAHPQANDEIKRLKCLGNLIIAGSMNGQLSKWDSSTKESKLLKQIKAHTKSIDDLDIDGVNNVVVTLSREEGRCAIWDIESLKLIREFKKDMINIDGGKYAFRNLRFAVPNSSNSRVIDNPIGQAKEASDLLIACNAITKGKSCKVCKFNSSNSWTSHQTLAIPVDGIMAMSVSDDSKFLAIGSRSGSVLVYNVKSFKNIYRLDNAHHNAITSVEFLPSNRQSLNLTGSNICPLISVSIDRRTVLHRPNSGTMYSIMRVIILMIVIILMFQFIMRYFEL